MSGVHDQDENEEFECRVLIVGYPGSGKSTLANKLIGKADVKVSSPEGNLAEEDQPRAGFMVSKGFDSATRKSQFQTGRIHLSSGHIISTKVVDTPSLFSPGEEDLNKTKAEIRRGLSLCSPGGPHAVLFVLPLGRFTEPQERSFLETLKMFGKKVENHLIVVFTHGENLKDRPLEETLAHTPVEGLRKIREVVGNKYVVTSNIPDRQASEVEALMDKIFQVKDRCGGHFVMEGPSTRKISSGIIFGLGVALFAASVVYVGVLAAKGLSKPRELLK